MSGYYAPITGNYVCDICGPYCNCNEDMASCENCGLVDHYENMQEIAIGRYVYIYTCNQCNKTN
jgi:hypothetical protein